MHAVLSRAHALPTTRVARLLLRALLPCIAAFVTACAPRTLTYNDGTPRAEGRVNWFDHRETGFWTYNFPNGALRERGRFEDGHRVGIWEQWFPNGLVRTRGERRFDPATNASEREGLWTLWHENGRVRASGVYRDGKREGHWDFSHPDGGLDGDRSGEYHDDVRID
jgi:antitoxin component YwqK of YwqJK toxin-antitoxin module